MMRRWTWLLAALALAGSAATAKAPPGAPTPLFASDAPIHVTIQGPMASLASNRSPTPRPATMTVDGVAYPITLTPRGITRLRKDTCDFPPIRVELTKPAPPGTLFHHQHRLKLTAFCKRSDSFQQKVLLEYSAYRLYNLMTPESFRARLANIDYLDESGRPYISRVGFFVEDFSDVAKRNGMTQAHMGALVPLEQIDPTAGARVALFEDMISNYDWSLRAGPQGTECCHNTRLMASAPGTPLTPVPYDFDYSGLVDASYAVPPEGVPIDSVRQRTYRGYCAHMAQARAVASELSRRRAEFTGLFSTIPGLDPREQAKAASYISAFFDDLDSGRTLKVCVS
jgi:hypothetical protein